MRQVGYVVGDIERAMNHWAAIGVGPWFYKRTIITTQFNDYGKPSAFPALSIALANSGDLQIELIQQHDESPTLYRDSLARQGEGAQHIAYWTSDRFDAMCGQLTAQGYTEGHAGRMGDMKRGRFAYFLRPDLPSAMFEISESTGGKAEYFETIRQASLHWDGQDPIRRMD